MITNQYRVPGGVAADSKLQHRSASLPNEKSAAPVVTNGASAAGKATRRLQVADRVEVSPRKYGLGRYILAGVMLAGALTGHMTNVTPSSTIAQITGDQALEDLQALEEYGTFRHDYEDVGAGKVYRTFGRLYNGYAPSLQLGEDLRVSIRNPDDSRQLLQLLQGEEAFGFSLEDISMARDISTHPEASPNLDDAGVILIVSLANGRRNYRDGRINGIKIENVEDLRRVHDLYFESGDGFSERDRALLPVVMKHSRQWAGDLFDVLDKVDAGQEVRFVYQAPADREITHHLDSRAELLEYGERLEAQLELDRYRPSPERLDQLVARPLQRVEKTLSVTIAQMAPLEGVSGVNQEVLENNQTQLRQALEQLQELRQEISDWDGGDAAQLKARVAAAAEQISGVGERMHRVNWNVYTRDRANEIGWGFRDLHRVINLTSKEKAPDDWTPPTRTLDNFTP